MQLHILEASSSFATRRHSTSTVSPTLGSFRPAPSHPRHYSKLPHASANLSSVLQASPPTPRPHMPRPHLGDTPSAHTPCRTRPPSACVHSRRTQSARRPASAAPSPPSRTAPCSLSSVPGVFVSCLLSAHMPRRPHLGDAPSAHTPSPARGHFRNAYTLADLVAHAVGTPAR